MLRKYGPDFKAIFVGDASMSPYEIIQPGGSVEHWNEESGAVWMQRLTGHFRRSAWLNPMPQAGLGPYPFDRAAAAADGEADVPADPRRDRGDDPGAEPLN